MNKGYDSENPGLGFHLYNLLAAEEVRWAFQRNMAENNSLSRAFSRDTTEFLLEATVVFRNSSHLLTSRS